MAALADKIAIATAEYKPYVTRIANGDGEVAWPVIAGKVVSQREAIASAAGIEADMIEVRSNDTLYLHIPAMVNGTEPPPSSLLTEYLGMHAELTDLVHRLSEFVASLPAPTDDDQSPAGVNWATIGSLAEIARLAGEAADMADQMG